MPVRSKWQSLPTEAINPSTLGIDKLAADDIVDLMINEDRKMLDGRQRERERIAVGVEMIATALRKGGRIVFVGAGTSGRLGILESAEMPPTFSTDPDARAGDHGRRPRRDLRARRKASRTTTKKAPRSITRLQPDARRTSSSACRPAA